MRRHGQRLERSSRPRSARRSRCRSTAPARCSSRCAPATATARGGSRSSSGFGPLYLEQVGFGVTVRAATSSSGSRCCSTAASRCSGSPPRSTTCSSRFVVASDASSSTRAAGRSTSPASRSRADLGRRSRSPGGLRKFGSGDTVEYLGMLLGPLRRLRAVGLRRLRRGHRRRADVHVVLRLRRGQRADRRPAGVLRHRHRRRLRHQPRARRARPTCRSSATTRSSRRSTRGARRADPMAELARLARLLPDRARHVLVRRRASRFTCFALVDGVAVVAVADRRRLRARPARPRPHGAAAAAGRARLDRARPGRALLHQEGVLWVQAQLTDNSWLLYHDVRLTGGFAFVIWFNGPTSAASSCSRSAATTRDFHRDGYPVVPRLGLQWRVGDAIVVKGESYFALTSEALMAGGRLEVSADFGPAWAHVVFGARRHRLLRPVPLRGRRLRVDLRRRHDRPLDRRDHVSVSLGARIDVEGPGLPRPGDASRSGRST